MQSFISLALLLLVAVLLPSLATADPDYGTLGVDRASARAVNRLAHTDDGIELRRPDFAADFTRGGVHVTPHRAGPSWQWQFGSLSSTAGSPLAIRRDIAPELGPDGTVRFARGPVVEQYVPRARGIEQQFILPAPLDLGGQDLIVSGATRSPGAFEELDRGWRWRTPTGAVTLGDVTVIDSRGHEIPATMQVTAHATRIVVDGRGLSEAIYPVTIDPEIGTNDFRISQMGTDGDSAIRARAPAVAYNPTDDEYLVVWQSDDLVQNELEIYGQRVDAKDGSLLGARIQISDMGPAANTAYQAFAPDVAFNATDGEYLVVWYGDDDVNGTDGKFDIYGQRLTASTGAPVGTNDFRISVMSTAGDTSVAAVDPKIAWDSTVNQYLVVWEGDDVDTQFEIYGQRLDGATATEVGADDFRISDMGTNDADPVFGAFAADVAYNSADGEFLVVWEGDDDTGLLIDDEFEIYGQRLTASTGAAVGSNDFRISQMGPADGIAAVGAACPAVAFDTTHTEYLVVWDADDLILGEFEIYGQRLDATTGAAVGTDDFRISDMGPDGDPTFMAFNPDVSYRASDDEYFVVWEGDEVNGEMEIYGQSLTGGSGAEVGDNDVRLSDMGPEPNNQFDGLSAAVAADSGATGYLVVWEGDDDTGALVNNEFEIYGQLYNPAVAVPALSVGFVAAATIALLGRARQTLGRSRRRV